jgi:hypothetical protein
MLYEKEFLDEYFEAKKLFEEDYTEINTQLIEDGFNDNQDKIF